MILSHSFLERVRFNPTDHLYLGHERYMRQCRVIDMGVPRLSGKTTTIFSLAGPDDIIIIENPQFLKWAKEKFRPGDRVRVITKFEMIGHLESASSIPVEYTNRIFIDEVPFATLELPLMDYTKKVLHKTHSCPLIVRLGTNV